MDSALIKCNNCGAANRIILKRLEAHPKCGKCKSSISVEKSPIDVTTSSFKNEVLSWPGYVLIDFWSPTCGHCLTLMPVFDDIASERAGALKIVRVNVATEQKIAAQFDIRGVPALFLYKGGKKVNDLSGALPKAQLDSWLNSQLR